MSQSLLLRRASDAGTTLSQAPPTPTPTPIAPVIKRRRRTSCLGEQERRERKRAIDREAQRSLREKTKTHIAELERTIQILRDQDRDGATASLLAEIDRLRGENERLREVIDSVKSVVGTELGRSSGPQNTVVAEGDSGRERRGSESGAGNGATSTSPKVRPPTSITLTDVKPPQQQQNQQQQPLLTPQSLLPPSMPRNAHHSPSYTPAQYNAITFGHPLQPTHHHLSNTSTSPIDLNGMSVLSHSPSHSHSLSPSLSLSLNLDGGAGGSGSNEEDMLDAPDSPTTAAFAPYIAEMFGPSWRRPSPVVLHLENGEELDDLRKEMLGDAKSFGGFRESGGTEHTVIFEVGEDVKHG